MKKENRRIPPPLLSKFQFFERHLEIVNPGGTKSRWALVRRAFRRGGSIPRSSRREEEGGEERRDYEKEGGARSRKVGGGRGGGRWKRKGRRRGRKGRAAPPGDVKYVS